MSIYYNLEASEVRQDNTVVCNFFHGVATLKKGQVHGGVVWGEEDWEKEKIVTTTMGLAYSRVHSYP